MERMNDMELAREIRKKDRNVAVAFLTNDPGFVFDGYEVEAVGSPDRPHDSIQNPAGVPAVPPPCGRGRPG